MSILNTFSGITALKFILKTHILFKKIEPYYLQSAHTPNCFSCLVASYKKVHFIEKLIHLKNTNR